MAFDQLESTVRRYGRLAAALAVVLIAAPLASAQGVYSYLDPQGVRTFTNIPPSGPIQDLKLSPAAIAQLDRSAPAPQASAPPAPAASAAVRGSAGTRYDTIIEKYASHYELDPNLIRAMISTESAFNERAISHKGARGLMQLMPETAARHGVRNIFDPEENIRGGASHMRELLDMFNNDLSLSLAAYNAGENLVARIQKVPNYRETRDYVRLVTARYGKSQVAPRIETAQGPAPMFRYTDRNGVMHLTNIPPVDHRESRETFSGGGASGQMP